MNIVIMGPVGSGKGTQAKVISEKYGVAHISTGDIMRSHIKNKTAIGLEIKAILDKGGYVNDNLTIELLKDRLKTVDPSAGYILDGFPRTVAQAEALDTITKVHKVVYLSIEDDVIIKRLVGRLTCAGCGEMYHIENKKPQTEGVCEKCNSPLYQRDDDKLEVIETRLKTFYEQTMPIVDYYKERNLLVEINGLGEISKVSNDLFENLKDVANATDA